jgi:hypothetical protein
MPINFAVSSAICYGKTIIAMTAVMMMTSMCPISQDVSQKPQDLMFKR